MNGPNPSIIISAASGSDIAVRVKDGVVGNGAGTGTYPASAATMSRYFGLISLGRPGADYAYSGSDTFVVRATFVGLTPVNLGLSNVLGCTGTVTSVAAVTLQNPPAGQTTFDITVGTGSHTDNIQLSLANGAALDSNGVHAFVANGGMSYTNEYFFATLSTTTTNAGYDTHYIVNVAFAGHAPTAFTVCAEFLTLGGGATCIYTDNGNSMSHDVDIYPIAGTPSTVAIEAGKFQTTYGRLNLASNTLTVASFTATLGAPTYVTHNGTSLVNIAVTLGGGTQGISGSSSDLNATGTALVSFVSQTNNVYTYSIAPGSKADYTISLSTGAYSLGGIASIGTSSATIIYSKLTITSYVKTHDAFADTFDVAFNYDGTVPTSFNFASNEQYSVNSISGASPSWTASITTAANYAYNIAVSVGGSDIQLPGGQNAPGANLAVYYWSATVSAPRTLSVDGATPIIATLTIDAYSQTMRATTGVNASAFTVGNGAVTSVTGAGPYTIHITPSVADAVTVALNVGHVYPTALGASASNTFSNSVTIPYHAAIVSFDTVVNQDGVTPFTAIVTFYGGAPTGLVNGNLGYSGCNLTGIVCANSVCSVSFTPSTPGAAATVKLLGGQSIYADGTMSTLSATATLPYISPVVLSTTATHTSGADRITILATCDAVVAGITSTSLTGVSVVSFAMTSNVATYVVAPTAAFTAILSASTVNSASAPLTIAYHPEMTFSGGAPHDCTDAFQFTLTTSHALSASPQIGDITAVGATVTAISHPSTLTYTVTATPTGEVSASFNLIATVVGDATTWPSNTLTLTAACIPRVRIRTSTPLHDGVDGVTVYADFVHAIVAPSAATVFSVLNGAPSALTCGSGAGTPVVATCSFVATPTGNVGMNVSLGAGRVRSAIGNIGNAVSNGLAITTWGLDPAPHSCHVMCVMSPTVH